MEAETNKENKELLSIFLQVLMTVKFDMYIRNSVIIKSLYDEEVRMQLLSVSQETTNSIFEIKEILNKEKINDVANLLSSIFYEFNSSVSADTTLENMITTYVCNNIINDFCKVGIKMYGNNSIKKLDTDKDLKAYDQLVNEYIANKLKGHTVAIDTLSMWSRKLISDVTFLFHELGRHINLLEGILEKQNFKGYDEENKDDLYYLYDYLMENHSERIRRIGFKI